MGDCFQFTLFPQCWTSCLWCQLVIQNQSLFSETSVLQPLHAKETFKKKSLGLQWNTRPRGFSNGPGVKNLHFQCKGCRLDPWRLRWQRICLQCRGPRFDSWVGKIPWRRERLPTPVFWPTKFHGLCSPWGSKELDMTEWLSLTVS